MSWSNVLNNKIGLLSLLWPSGNYYYLWSSVPVIEREKESASDRVSEDRRWILRDDDRWLRWYSSTLLWCFCWWDYVGSKRWQLQITLLLSPVLAIQGDGYSLATGIISEVSLVCGSVSTLDLGYDLWCCSVYFNLFF